MVRHEVLLPRFRKFDEYLDILRGMRRYTLDEFTADPERYGSAERFLQLAIETLNDIGNHIIADDDLGPVQWYSDIPKNLREHGRITSEQHDMWLRMIGFRNLLVHDYLRVDRAKVHAVLQKHLHDFESLQLALSAVFREDVAT
jgi:uncharacterized protein YutE (UPF0331/DUF86 family)